MSFFPMTLNIIYTKEISFEAFENTKTLKQNQKENVSLGKIKCLNASIAPIWISYFSFWHLIHNFTIKGKSNESLLYAVVNTIYIWLCFFRHYWQSFNNIQKNGKLSWGNVFQILKLSHLGLFFYFYFSSKSIFTFSTINSCCFDVQIVAVK